MKINGRRRAAIAIGVALCLTAWATAFAQNGSVGYTYDALGRLMSATYDTGACLTYTYDANGNRLSQTITVSAAGSPGTWGCMRWGQANWSR